MAESKDRKALVAEIEEQASLYALGALPEEEARRFRERLQAGCELCAAEVIACERALTALALTVPELAAPPGARARLLQSLGITPEPEGLLAMGPGTLLRAQGTPWQNTPLPGVEIRHLHDKKTLLVRMAPKSWLAAHEHEHAEQCLVLEGSVSGDGLTAYAGDFTYMPAGSSHHPLYSEAGCLLLIAYA